MMMSESGGRRSAGGLSLIGPASRGGVSTRLLWVPMLRWSLPLGLVLGVVLGLADIRGVVAWEEMRGFGVTTLSPASL